ncbi:MAG: glycosyltransferase family 2 protein [Candidatus Bathyarchaeia archaeon]
MNKESSIFGSRKTRNMTQHLSKFTICGDKNSNSAWSIRYPDQKTVAAVIVTYYPDEALLQRLKGIASQFDELIIIDNTPNNEAKKILDSAAKQHKCRLIINKENLGIATALNQGAEFALDIGLFWVAFFDQDSLVMPSYLKVMRHIYESYGNQPRIGIIGANYIHPVTGLPALQSAVGNNAEFFEVESVITSGSLLNLEAFKAVGKFRDEFFIDQVDEEYCLRLRSHGWKVLISREPLLVCRIGSPAMRRLWTKKIYPSNHPPIRRYYITRNRFVLWKEYLLREPRWVARSFRCALIELILILLCEDQKFPKLKAMALGALHGAIGRMGRLEVPWGL